MRELDERAVREFKTPSLLLMENAGRSVAEEILKTGAGKIAIVSGKGNNGGDGFVVARHLHNHGRDVEVTFIGERGQLKGDSLINFEILEKLGVPLGIHTKDWDWGDADLVVDAIFGTGLSKNVEEPYKSAIEEINKLSAGGTTVVSIDVPSGLNADSGEVMGVAVHADITVTLASEKMGLRKGDGPRYAGQIVVGYISMPRALLNPNQF
ncbi:MAG: NAD(P)H-hydrate epimerase [Candidatus Omnitrophica bacterium]|nr:NAD(P)H-hydrate epimerase [Candidatus Omnitrophota bacterium]